MAKEVETTIRIDVERLDEIMNLVGELVLSRNRLMKLSSDLESRLAEDERYESLVETVSHLNIITTNLQMGVMKTRMQPVRRLLNKFPRMVRDIAKKRGKEIEFVVEGEETELDKSVLDEIGDPLIHLVRNSIDHGIEEPDVRVRNSKPPKGRVTLRAFHEGNRIGISISDDGRGMDIARIKQKALETGKVTTDDLERMTRDEILNLIFLPGFSTAKQVDDVSGRGVGMDVVRNNVSKLNGTIEINTEEDKGSTITLRLPLTIAIIQTLLVRECGQVFALPLTSVLEIAKLRAEEIRLVNRRRVLNLRNHILPLSSVGEKFGLHGARSLEECAYVIVLGIAEKRVGLAVGELLGGEEITIKSVGKVMTDVRGIAGASITGDGQIVLVADLPELFSDLAVGFHEKAA
ncbi:MAG: chemotaxis protein CheA [Nitrospirae bacterium]|nr:chemotaxis protein CheA [Nitrospirota bacterium]